MAKDPAFLFYSQDFIVGVQTLTYEERGKYITILAQMHQQGRMNEETIRFLVGNVSVNLKSKFSVDGNDLWYNKRLEAEIEKRVLFTESRRINGSKGGRPKKSDSKKKPLAKPSANHMGSHMENENESVNSISNNKLYKEEFEEFRVLYPGRKRGLETEFENFVKKNKDWKAVAPTLTSSLKTQINDHAVQEKEAGFAPRWKDMGTWINNRCWEQEPAAIMKDGFKELSTKEIEAMDDVSRAAYMKEKKKVMEKKAAEWG